MPFRPNVNDELTINGITYRIAEHPAAPGIPYGQEGRAGIVYQLLPVPSSGGLPSSSGRGVGGEGKMALKVFKSRFRTPALVSQAEKLNDFASLPGLTVCKRIVLTPNRHADLLRREPDLTYAALMPWVEGPTWQEVLLEKRLLTPQQSLELAREFVQIMVRMEEQGLAHCDLSGPNVLLPGLEAQSDPRPISAVELVDIEGLYAPSLPRPESVASGSSGYAHRTAHEGLWGSTADRFAGAVLLAEMLGWGDETVRKACYGETYFDPAEMPTLSSPFPMGGEVGGQTDRYSILHLALARQYGQPVANMFERAWRSETLADCPTFGEWLVALPDSLVSNQSLAIPQQATAKQEQITSEGTTISHIEPAAEIRAFIQVAQQMVEKGNLKGALELYRQAQELARADSSLRSMALEIELTIQEVQKQFQAVQLPYQEVYERGRSVTTGQLPKEGQTVAPLERETQPRHRWKWIPIWGMLLGLIVLVLAVIILFSLNFQQQQVAQANATASAWQQQAMATIEGQTTSIARAQATLQARTIEQTRIAQEMQASVLAEQIVQLTQQAGQTHSNNLIPAATEAVSSPTSSIDIENKIKNAKILLFEDMSGTGEVEYYQEALERAGYTFKDDGSAQGWFKDDLLSSTEWDLIIAASEIRTQIQGEFFVYLMDHIDRGAAVIIEHWALDDLSQGKVAPILSKCGVGLHRDWYFQEWNFADLSVYPLIPDHPIWSTPNKGVSLRNFSVFWANPDQGDLLRITRSGDAQLIAGTIPTSKFDHGVIASCLGGRMIIQTFSSHNYRRDMVNSLIQNYVHYTLTNRFLSQP